MKDLTITVRRQRTEIAYFAGSFIVANLFNAFAIWHYNAPASEMLSSFFYVLAFSFVIYFITVITRVIINMIKNIFRRRKSL